MVIKLEDKEIVFRIEDKKIIFIFIIYGTGVYLANVKLLSLIYSIFNTYSTIQIYRNKLS